MKYSILALSVCTLAACSTNPKPADAPAQLPAQPAAVAAVQAPPPHPYALPPRPVRTVSQAPEWFVKLPQDTDEMIFGVGTATSADEQMAYDKARLQAERKIVEMLSARVRSQVFSNRTDNGDDMLETTTVTVQKNAEGDLIGAQRVDSQAQFDGRRYKVYILVRYPLGENNNLLRAKNSIQLKRESELRAQRAQQDLDLHSQQRRQDTADADKRLREQVGPRSQAQPVDTTPQTRVEPVQTGPETVNTNNGPVQLLEVENPEYRARRAEALTKPGAVLGQITVR